MTTLGARLRDARRRRGWTQLRLASEAGLGHGTIERAEAGTRTPRVENVQALARALQVQPAWLAYGEEPMALPSHMTVAAQFEMHTGPGTEGRPGYVIVEPGPWEVGEDGEWTAAGAGKENRRG